MKWELAEFACEQEATPGTAETLVSGDVLVKLRKAFDIDPGIELHDPEEISSVSSPSVEDAGMRTYRFTVPYRLRGPGDLVTAPAVVDLWEMAMLSGAAASTLPIGAVTSGPFVAGEIVTGGTSAATGRVLQQTADGASTIPVLVISGTFDVGGETITGGTSGASASTSAGVSAAGYCFLPADSSDLSGHAATCMALVDGMQWTARGCLSDIEWAFRNGRSCVVTQNIVGARSSEGDQALFGVTSFPEADVSPEKSLNTALYTGSYQPSDIVDLTLAFRTNPGPREDMNASAGDGVTLFDYKRERPTVRFAIAQVLAATKDYFTLMQGNTVERFEFTHGSTTGSKWTFSAPAAQIRSIKPGMREPNLAVWEIELGLTGDDNNELIVWQH